MTVDNTIRIKIKPNEGATQAIKRYCKENNIGDPESLNNASLWASIVPDLAAIDKSKPIFDHSSGHTVDPSKKEWHTNMVVHPDDELDFTQDALDKILNKFKGKKSAPAAVVQPQPVQEQAPTPPVVTPPTTAPAQETPQAPTAQSTTPPERKTVDEEQAPQVTVNQTPAVKPKKHFNIGKFFEVLAAGAIVGGVVYGVTRDRHHYGYYGCNPYYNPYDPYCCY